MKLAICGSREINLSVDRIERLATYLAIDNVTEIVSGGARGIDSCAKLVANEFELDFTEFPADWDGPFGKRAGFERNTLIANYADYLLVIRYLDSKGSKYVASEFRRLGKPVYEIILPRLD